MIFILIKNDETKGFPNLINVSCITLKCNIVLKYVSVLNSKIPLLFGVQLLTLHYKGVTKKSKNENCNSSLSNRENYMYSVHYKLELSALITRIIECPPEFSICSFVDFNVNKLVSCFHFLGDSLLMISTIASN